MTRQDAETIRAARLALGACRRWVPESLLPSVNAVLTALGGVQLRAGIYPTDEGNGTGRKNAAADLKRAEAIVKTL